MGNHPSRRTSAASACKVILLDGSVATLDDGAATSVAELMLEHPQQFAVELGPLLAGRKPAPLPAEHRLERGKVYAMLPMKPGRALSAPSPAEARQVLSRSRALPRSGSFPSLPSPSKGGLPAAEWWCRQREAPRALGGDGPAVAPAGKTDTAELLLPSSPGAPPTVGEYLKRQVSGGIRPWRPSLHTIEEKVPRKKTPHWLFLHNAR